ncbi:MAG TPA: hypothetical protein VIJ62_10670 [Rhizomicrobium sp.]
MRKLIGLCGIVLTVALAGCNAQDLFNKFVSKEEAPIARRYMEDIRTGNFAPVEDKFDPVYKTPALRPSLEKMASLFPKETPKSIKIIGTQTGGLSDFTTYNLTFEYEFPHGWTVGNILLKKTGSNLQIEGGQVIPLKDSMEHHFAFTFEGKGAVHYIFLILAILLPVFCLVTAIVCYRTPIPRRKWLWLIFTLLGFVSFNLNWTTGAVSYQLISFAFLGAAYTQQFYGPIIIQIAFPFGAIMFWMRRREWIAKSVSIN